MQFYYAQGPLGISAREWDRSIYFWCSNFFFLQDILTEEFSADKTLAGTVASLFLLK